MESQRRTKLLNSIALCNGIYYLSALRHFTLKIDRHHLIQQPRALFLMHKNRVKLLWCMIKLRWKAYYLQSFLFTNPVWEYGFLMILLCTFCILLSNCSHRAKNVWVAQKKNDSDLVFLSNEQRNVKFPQVSRVLINLY